MRATTAGCLPGLACASSRARSHERREELVRRISPPRETRGQVGDEPSAERFTRAVRATSHSTPLHGFALSTATAGHRSSGALKIGFTHERSYGCGPTSSLAESSCSSVVVTAAIRREGSAPQRGIRRERQHDRFQPVDHRAPDRSSRREGRGGGQRTGQMQQVVG